jgi:hypothetical protein
MSGRKTSRDVHPGKALWNLLVAFAAAWEQRQFIGLFLIYTNEGSRQSKKFIGLLFIYALFRA